MKTRMIVFLCIVFFTAFSVGCSKSENVVQKEEPTAVPITVDAVMLQVKEVRSRGLMLPMAECEKMMKATHGSNWRKNAKARMEYYACRAMPAGVKAD